MAGGRWLEAGGRRLEVGGARWLEWWLEVVAGGWWQENGGVAGVVGWYGWSGGYLVWRVATEPNRNSAILAIHIPLNTAYVSVSTEPPDYNHDDMISQNKNQGGLL